VSFFKKEINFLNLKEISEICAINLNSKYKDKKIFNTKNLYEATENDLTFFSDSKYINQAKKTKARACITSDNLSEALPSTTIPLLSNIPLINFYKIVNKFYPDSSLDDENIFDKKKNTNIYLGKYCLIDYRSRIGDRTKIGNNVIIKKNVCIGKNCIIGSNVIIENALVGDNVLIKSGTLIGQIGFGFKFINGERLRFPHLGRVIIENSAQIGSYCTIDRGSLGDTVIGEFSSLDNQIQIAHNVKIGNYCMIAAQCGIAGSTIVGNNVLIGGQSGISGHLKIGNNVKIGGKSGVTSNLEDGASVMGYPAVGIREFAKMRNSYEKKRN